MARRLGHPGMLGRDAEQRLLLALLRAAQRGRSRVALISGEPGIGKTRLLSVAAARARRRGALVLWGRAYETAGMPPYLPVVEALSECAQTLPREELRGLLGERAATLAQLVPALRSALPDLPEPPALAPEMARYRLFEDTSEALRAIGHAAPGALLLVLDDLHWADESTLLLLKHLAQRLAGARLLLALGYRTVDPALSSALQDALAEFVRQGVAVDLPLGPLAPEETAALIGRIAGAPPSAELSTAVHRASGGNPFFAGELARHLRAEGGQRGTDAAQLRIPPTVRLVVARRLDRLSAAARAALDVAAVLGERFAFAVLARAAGVAAEALTLLLDEAIAAGLVTADGGYQFAHALVRGVLYEALSPPRREQLHLAAGEAIEAVYGANHEPQLAALALHFRLAGERGLQKAIDYAVAAGEAAQMLYAWREAADLYRTAVELCGERDAGQRLELLLALGQALTSASDFAAARAAYDEAADLALRLGLAEAFARAAFGRAQNLGTGAGDPIQDGRRALELLERALDMLPAEDSPLRAVVLARASGMLSTEPRAAARIIALATEAVSMARRLHDPLATYTALAAGRHTAPPAERFAGSAEMIVCARVMRDFGRELEARHLHIGDLLMLGDVRTADVEIAHHNAGAERLRQPHYLWRAKLLLATRATMAGRFDEAERLATEAREYGVRLQEIRPNACYRAQMFLIRREQGRLGELEADVRASRQRTPMFTCYSARLVCILHALGREAEARAIFEQLAKRDFGDLLPFFDWQWTTTILSAGCALLADARRAAILYRMLLPRRGSNIIPIPEVSAFYGAADHHLGLLAATMRRYDDAIAHFEGALRMHEQVAALPSAAHTRRELAAALLARDSRGDRERATQLAQQAEVVYAELGMDSFAREAGRLRSPSSPPFLRSAPSNGLTQREIEVLRLLAQGLSNREIADRLSIAQSTAIRHVEHIFARIGAANRVEAAAYAFRAGIAQAEGAALPRVTASEPAG